jgi:hypothetical protein
MRKIFAWIAPIVWFGDEIVRRIVYWTAFFVLVSATMSWVASYITPISQYGWGAVVFAGIGMACVITLSASGAFAAWRYFNPLPEQSSISERVPPAPPAPFDAALYVGSVWNVSADFTKIKDEPSFAITIHISNQTDKNIAIESVRGNLIFERWTLPAVSPPENMPVIAIAHQHDGAAFTIRQGITKEQRDRICEVLESGGIVTFDFNLIRFLVRVDNAERAGSANLNRAMSGVSA